MQLEYFLVYTHQEAKLFRAEMIKRSSLYAVQPPTQVQPIDEQKT